ncbi:MAG: 50S ribosomal protein L22 [Candidatus Staskawiczbacteria bacterium CG10_big_fil_rev_8_21_14_0_10_38_10]|uniref:Large ribosomal subunit protein uL22 n=1 Tax=Candidatus Staskawiczbacteria bacterium CG10_big_fil_rev_8_21_14_0_10_38_10 TaxID=1974891 RepID=A0A2H9T248_9BACT|nr:MAG: 50S ribosomal protein L22 [Candidatus Staskawiczbacteria bacterium CG10_big_fil_rev_8_21_14_0_10_38_10]
MEVIAKLRYLHITPRKVREVVDLIRGKKVDEAITLLEFLVKKPATPVLKLLKSAAASAQHNFKLDQSSFYISKIFVDEGPKFKRWKPASRGRAATIIKRASHITLVLDEIEKSEKTKEKKPSDVGMKEEKISEKSAEEKRLKKKARKQATFKTEKKIKKHGQEAGPRKMFQRKAF